MLSLVVRQRSTIIYTFSMALNVIAIGSDVLCYSVLEFLSMGDIVRLDSAVAGDKEGRRLLTERLRLLTYAEADSLVFTSDSGAMKWFLHKRVQLASLAFGVAVQDDLIIQFSELFKSLKSITWNASYITDLAVAVVAKHCPRLQTLKLIKCYNATDSSMLSLAEHCTDLRTFHMTYNCEVTMDGFVAVLRACTKLAHIGISCCRHLDGSILTEIARLCPVLNTLSIGNLRNTTEAHLAAFQGRCLSLQTIDFQTFPGVSGSVLANMTEQYTALQSLRLHHFGIKDSSLKRIVSQCTQLRTLYLAGCRNISDSGVLVVALNCPLLECIDLSRCIRITDDSLVALAEHCPYLSSVSVSHCLYVTDTGISAISRQCPELRALHMSRCGIICERTLVAAITRCRGLTSLELGGSRVTTNAVVSIATLCTELTVLTLDSCDKLSRWCARAICHFLGKLQVLQLLDNEWLTNDHIAQIAERCPDLVTLGIGSKLLRRRFVLNACAVEALSLHCRRLSYLGTCECSAGAWQVAIKMAADHAHRGIPLDLQLTPLSPTPFSAIRSLLHW